MKETIYNINNTPRGEELWRSISGNFQRFPQILNELVDDALSNFRAYAPAQRRVEIRLAHRGDHVEVTVADTGIGILDLDAALRLGCKSAGETPLNEHGMGLKHALASAVGTDDRWSIQTRTQADAALDRHTVVEGPYRFTPPMTAALRPGRGSLPADTGTAISFTCPWDLFLTIRPTGDRTEKSFETLVDILLEELGYTYAPILEDREMELVVMTGGHEYPVVPIFPDWDLRCFDELPPTTLDLGGGPVTVNCCWGLIEGKQDNYYYYRGNLESSGVEIRCNGRVIEHGMDKRIWAKQPHPSRNHFLAVVELKAEDAGALPPTKPTKTGFRDGDPRLEKLCAWVRTNVTLPAAQESMEKRLVQALANKKKAAPGALRVALEEKTYRALNLGVKMDLLVSSKDSTEVYEAKKNRSRVLDLYQLRMYWDGCAVDGCPLSSGVLVARSHPQEVRNLVKALNDSYRDPTGRPYHLSLSTWAEEGIDPKAV